ncbi:hypothetical protein EBZ80_01040 [bacterium]|nr:hypothetical protein [bacterium]
MLLLVFLWLLLIGSASLLLVFRVEFLYLYRIQLRREKDPWKALRSLVRMGAWMGYLLVYQQLARSLVQVKKGVYDVHYVYHGQLYKIRIQHQIGSLPTSVLMITDQDSESVTDLLAPYMGPKNDFHGLVYTPKTFGLREATFFLSDGDTASFREDEPMLL